MVQLQADIAAQTESPTRVVFSLTVTSEHPIAALSNFPVQSRALSPDDDFIYAIDKVFFDEDDTGDRADLLDAAVNDALDRLIMSGIDVAELHRDDVYVRAFYTFSPGSETIRPEVVKRLARINATIWIDAEL
ncbi:MAG: hypothetical protein ABIP33_06090 [Pseudolysinimonas sp.]